MHYFVVYTDRDGSPVAPSVSDEWGVPRSHDSLERIVDNCKALGYTAKLFNENGFIRGTVYPNGEVVT